MAFFNTTWNTIQELNATIESTNDENELLYCLRTLQEISTDIEELADTLRYKILGRRISNSLRAIDMKFKEGVVVKNEEIQEEEESSVDEEIQEEEESSVDAETLDEPIEEEQSLGAINGICAIAVTVIVLYGYGIFLMMTNKQ